MYLYFDLFGFHIPSYGLCIVLGLITSNLLAIYVSKKKKMELDNFITLEAYGILGAFIGAKLLYLIVSFRDIDWNQILNVEYFSQLMQGGFVFYGGLIGGLLFIFIGGKIHKLNTMEYVRKFVFIIPFGHCFGRIGCFMAGCCYGIPYSGIGAVVFPKGSYAPADIELFPVQLVEAILLMVIALLILILEMKCDFYFTIETYLVLYGITRFVLENFRYDDARGYLFGLSTSQWISVLVVFASVWFVSQNKKVKE